MYQLACVLVVFSISILSCTNTQVKSENSPKSVSILSKLPAELKERFSRISNKFPNWESFEIPQSEYQDYLNAVESSKDVLHLIDTTFEACYFPKNRFADWRQHLDSLDALRFAFLESLVLDLPVKIQDSISKQEHNRIDFKALYKRNTVESELVLQEVSQLSANMDTAAIPGFLNNSIYINGSGKLAKRLMVFLNSKYPKYAFDTSNVNVKGNEKSLKQWQKDHNLFADGVWGRGCYRFLKFNNYTKLKYLGAWKTDKTATPPFETGVYVNLPEFKAYIYESGAIIDTYSVIVGAVKTPTEIALYDTIVSIVFNPQWSIPYSIVSKEMVPKLQKDLKSIRHKNYEIKLGDKWILIDSLEDSKLKNLSKSSVIRQRSGDDNALGKVKFLFPNKHAIYLHDTPNRGLFAYDARDMSHGCIRMKNPKKFAEYLWKRDGRDTASFNKLWESNAMGGVALKNKLPIYLDYQAVYYKDSKFNYAYDMYGKINLK